MTYVKVTKLKFHIRFVDLYSPILDVKDVHQGEKSTIFWSIFFLVFSISKLRDWNKVVGVETMIH